MKINKSLSLEPRFYNKIKLNLTINPDTIQTSVPDNILNELQKNDENPFYAIEEIEDITEPANGVEFILDFWKSYLAILKERPIPGSKEGHLSPWSYATPTNDFYTVGGKIENNKVFLKIYVPLKGFETLNDTFIRDIKVKLIHFSVVSWTEDLIETNENGDITSIKAIRAVKGNRNDAVEVGMGAMDQKVNKDKTGSDPEKTEEYIMADKVYKDIVKNLNNQIENGTVSKIEVAKSLNIEVATEEQKQSVKILKEITDILGENPVAAIQEMKANAETVKQQAYDNMREKAMSDNFGPEKIKVNGKDEINLKRDAAEPHVSKKIQDEKTLKEQIEAAKENLVVKSLSFQTADINSDVNDLSGVKMDAKKEYRTSEHVEA